MIWISFVFLQVDRISEEIVLKSSNSHDIELNFDGKGIGYYKVFMPEFTRKQQVFVQILDKNQNIISEESVHTKMSVGYFNFEKSGTYTAKVNVVPTTLPVTNRSASKVALILDKSFTE